MLSICFTYTEHSTFRVDRSLVCATFALSIQQKPDALLGCCQKMPAEYRG
jgi:hypothetical protein